jgi:hypothetical protein
MFPNNEYMNKLYMSKTLVLYIFHTFNDRVRHFFENAIFEDDNVDFIVICNNRDEVFDVPSNVVLIRRDNIGYDFGGWSEALLTDELYQRYDNFIFANSSIIGPFLPADFQGRWTEKYLGGLVQNVKLFGSTICATRRPMSLSHLQSYIFCMNKNTLIYLIERGIFSLDKHAKTMEDAVYNREVHISRCIIEKGWNIGALHSYYKDVDFTFRNKRSFEYKINWLDDIMYERYRNVLWKEDELVFIKGNRDIQL